MFPMRDFEVVEASPEPARGRLARSMSIAGGFGELERAFRRAAAAAETVAHRFMIPTWAPKTMVARDERPREGTRPTICRPGPPTRRFMVPRREQKTVEASHEPARGRLARSMSIAGGFGELERAFRRAAAAIETVARRFLVQQCSHFRNKRSILPEITDNGPRWLRRL
ncbi:MAG: hypothetical protein DME26_09515, partial [Verrucomicrobia bacterium]